VEPVEQFGVSQASGGDLIAGGIEGGKEVYRGLVPARGEPEDATVAAVLVNLSILAGVEFQTLAIFEVGHDSPGRFPGNVALLGWDAKLGRAFLELHGVATGLDGGVDQLLGDCQVAVVVDADLGNEKGGAGLTNDAGPDGDRASHASDRTTDRPEA